MSHRLLPIVVCVAALTAVAPGTLGCSREEMSFQSAAASPGSVVFIGRVRSWAKEPLFTGGSEFYPRYINVDVIEVVKGILREKSLRLTGYGSGLCDASLVAFEVGSVWGFLKGRQDEESGAARIDEAGYVRLDTRAAGQVDPVAIRRLRRMAKGHTGP